MYVDEDPIYFKLVKKAGKMKTRNSQEQGLMLYDKGFKERKSNTDN